MFFSDPKYPSPTRSDIESKNYGYFMGILIIDPNRPGPDKNGPEFEPKISKYLLCLNI